MGQSRSEELCQQSSLCIFLLSYFCIIFSFSTFFWLKEEPRQQSLCHRDLCLDTALDTYWKTSQLDGKELTLGPLCVCSPLVNILVVWPSWQQWGSMVWWMKMTESDVLVKLHNLLSSWGGEWRYQIGWIFGKVPRGGAGAICNQKIYTADFGNFKQGFVSMKLIKRRVISWFRVCFFNNCIDINW